MDMTGKHLDDLRVATHDLFAELASLQSDAVHPPNAGFERWLMDTKNCRRVRVQRQLCVEPRRIIGREDVVARVEQNKLQGACRYRSMAAKLLDVAVVVSGYCLPWHGEHRQALTELFPFRGGAVFRQVAGEKEKVRRAGHRVDFGDRGGEAFPVPSGATADVDVGDLREEIRHGSLCHAVAHDPDWMCRAGCHYVPTAHLAELTPHGPQHDRTQP